MADVILPMKNETIIPSFTCDICCDIFTSSSKLKRHVINKHSYHKKLCENTITNNKKNQTTNSNLIQCDKCDNIFDNIANLNSHSLLCHNSDKIKVIKCDKCDLTINSTQVLRIHLRIDHGLTKIDVCDICDLIISNRKYLKKHIESVHHR